MHIGTNFADYGPTATWIGHMEGVCKGRTGDRASFEGKQGLDLPPLSS